MIKEDIREIFDLEKRKDEKKELFASEIQKIENEIAAIRSLDLENTTRRKVTEIFENVSEIVDRLIQTEELLYPNSKNFRTAFSSVQPKYDEENFIHELKNNYDEFASGISSIDSYKVSKQKEKILQKLGKNYAVIKDIHQNLDSLISKHINEMARKNEELSKLQKQKESTLTAFRDEEKKNDFLAIRKIDDLVEKVENMEKRIEMIGGIPEKPIMSSDYSTIEIPIGIELDDAETVQFPTYSRQVVLPKNRNVFKLDPIENKHMVITYSKNCSEEKRLWDMLRCIVIRFLLSYPGHDKRVVSMYSATLSGELGNIMSCVKKCCDKNMFVMNGLDTVATDDGEMRKTVSRIISEIKDRSDILNNSDCETILEYNVKNADNILPYVLFILKDIDFNGDLGRKIGDIARECRKKGVYMIVMNTAEKYVENLNRLKEYNENNVQYFSEPFVFDGVSGNLIKNDLKLDCTRNKDLLNAEYYASIRELASIKAVTIDFETFHNEQDALLNKKRVQDEMVVPVGKHGSDAVSISLESDTPFAHVIIEGMSGVGKTALLHSIILSAAYHYSPEQLEIWIFDFMQGGKDFEPYKKLAHVKYMALDCNPLDASEMLDHVSNVLSRRGAIKGTNNPRTIIVIDEYSIMKRDCVKKLEILVRQIRKYGASLILSSQDAPFPEVTEQVSHRFEMYKETRYSLIPGANDNGDMTPDNRVSVYQGKNKSLTSMRFAFAGNKEKMAALIQKINDRFGAKCVGPIIMGVPRTVDFSARKKAIYDNTGSEKTLRVYLGERVFTSDTVEYKINYKNRFLYIFGDKKRASYIEYIIAEAFENIKAKNDNVYYMNFAPHDDNKMQEFIARNPENCSKSPKGCSEIIKKLYDILNLRKHEIYDEGREIEYPIEVIIHSAGKTDEIFGLKASVVGSYKSSNNDSASKSDEELEKSLFGLPDEPISFKQEISDDEMLKELINAPEGCKINFVIHFDDVNELERSKVFSSEISRIKDCIIAPSIPDLNEVNFMEIINTLRTLRQSDFAEYYSEKEELCGKESDREKARNSFKQLIIIDENKPSVYLPYEKNFFED